MKLIIDIDEDLYEMCRDSLGDEDNIEGIIANGTPLEDIKAEIKKGLDIIGTCEDYEQGYDNATNRALKIIDKCIEAGEEK